MDNIKKIEQLCERVDGLMNSITEAMKETGDIKLIDIMIDDTAWQKRGDLDVAFYAWSELFVYFLERLQVPYSDGETEVYISYIPITPIGEKPTWYGGYSR